MQTPRTFELRGEGGIVAVEVLRYENPDSPDATDRNWLACQVTVDVPPFSGAFAVSLLADDLIDLGTALREFLDGSHEELSFEPFEQWISFRIAKRSRGHAEVTGTLRATVERRAELSFSIVSDQSYLSATLSSLEGLQHDFPMVGGPHL